jgi:hypothetical protein
MKKEFGFTAAVPSFPFRLGSCEPALRTKYTTRFESLSTAQSGYGIPAFAIPPKIG